MILESILKYNSKSSYFLQKFERSNFIGVKGKK